MSQSGFMLRSPAKLNWTLEILGRRADGFHELKSWFVAVGLYDEVHCFLRTDPQSATEPLQISGPASSGLPNDRTNLVLRAEQAWRAAGGEAPPVTWSLIKNIPIGAGLGGGSGDAAAALLLLETIGDGSAIADLPALALSIGSDLPFFLQQHSAVLLGGRGEKLLASTSAPTGWVVLAVPDFAVSTAKVFAELKAAPFPAEGKDASQARQGAGKGDSTGTHESQSADASANASADGLPTLPTPNDLIDAAARAYPDLGAFHDMLDAGADFQLSGSGGTFFAFFPGFGEAEACAAQTRAICEQVFVAPVQSGSILRQPSPLPSTGQQA